MEIEKAKAWLEVFNDKLKESIGNGDLQYSISILNGIKVSQAIDIILNTQYKR